jgi:tetratricopeptide (TPR) repeat protein
LSTVLVLVAGVVLAVCAAFLVAYAHSIPVTRRMQAIARHVYDGDLDGARTLVERWDRGNGPQHPLARVKLAGAWSMVGDHQRVLQVLDGTKLPKGRRGRSLRRMASDLRFRTLKAIGDEDRAEWVLRDTVAKDPTAPWLAIASSERASPTGTLPRDPRVLALLVQDALEDRRFEEAADIAERLVSRIAANPLDRWVLPYAYQTLGTAQLAAGRDSAADASFRESVRRAPDRGAAEKRVMSARAGALLVAGRLAEAAPAYEALVADQGTADAFAGLAMCRIRQGEVERAAHDLDRADALGYASEKARFLRAQILVDQGRPAEAVALARDAAGARASSDPLAAYTLAYVLATAQHPDAEAALRRYVELQPNDPDLPRLLDRPAPRAMTWRGVLEVAPRPDLSDPSTT